MQLQKYAPLVPLTLTRPPRRDATSKMSREQDLYRHPQGMGDKVSGPKESSHRAKVEIEKESLALAETGAARERANPQS
jgi:hypothetical protein